MTKWHWVTKRGSKRNYVKSRKNFKQDKHGKRKDKHMLIILIETDLLNLETAILSLKRVANQPYILHNSKNGNQ